MTKQEYSKKRNFNKPLFFVHGRVNKLHCYISIIMDDVFTTLSFKETCLYDTNEVQRVLSFLKLRGVECGVGLALSYTLPPKDFVLDNPKQITIYEAQFAKNNKL